MSTHVTFKPKQVTKRLLEALSDRARDVITSRYGLDGKVEKMTLEAIGKAYDITRERVRQIENHSLAVIRKSKEYLKEKKVFDELKDILHKLGGVIAEKDFLEHITKDESAQNHINFLLITGEEFKRSKEDEHFSHRWFVDETHSKKVEEALKKLYEKLNDNDLMTESEIIASFFDHLKDISEQFKNEEIAKRWLKISKKIDKNPLGEWGKSQSPNINVKGVRDYAFLVLRRHGSPIHFRDVAKSITEIFKKKAHVATTHNELIKDSRFVLVGRGLYALAEWGYISGVVKDVIRKILEKHGPLTKDEIIAHVLKERYVKENTILVNLQNPKFFKRDKDGKYSIIPETTKVKELVK
ncbi:MAG: sigma factor-like helix-turn-helix DNA-binding protein [Candidatus Paceibacterota bacterium]|jgi:hypothetical protein